MMTNEALVERVHCELESALCAPDWPSSLAHVHAAIAALTPPAAEGEIVAYLKEWIFEGEPRSRLDRKADHAPWLDAYSPTVTPLVRLAHAAPKVAGDSSDLLLLRAALCFSGFAGEGLCVEGFEDPADLYMEIARALDLEEADDIVLRAHIAVEQSRFLAAAPSAPGSGEG